MKTKQINNKKQEGKQIVSSINKNSKWNKIKVIESG